MVKLVSPWGWDFDRPAVIPVNVSSRGLVGYDRAAFVKAAGHVFLPYIDRVKFAPGEEPVHVISHGATEYWAANRNGDGFKVAACRRYAPTFEKYGHWHRNHKNKVADGDPFFGSIKKAAYNEQMRRVELLVGLFKTKEAADAAGGRVADKELEKLARGDDLAVSMACSVPYDNCSFCGHQARTRDEYCTPALCKAGGCKDNLTRLVKVGGDLHHLHVDNRHPTWFDMSLVHKPADRTAYGSRADYLVKAAADSWDGSWGEASAKVAADLEVAAPLGVLLEHAAVLPFFSHDVAEQVKLAHGLDLLERRPGLHPPAEYRRAFARRSQGDFDVAALGAPGTRACSEKLAALAERHVVLPLRDFARLAGADGGAAEQARQRLPGVYGRMLADGSLERRLAQNPYALTKSAGAAAQRFARAHAAGFALTKEAAQARCLRDAALHAAPPIADYSVPTKAAADAGPAEELARAYACYKVAALQRAAGDAAQFMLTAQLSLLQNTA